MHQMAINVNKAGAIIVTLDQMGVPDFIKECFWF
jgi:hypothetical protein